jgi:hypothetical protein
VDDGWLAWRCAVSSRPEEDSAPEGILLPCHDAEFACVFAA